MSSGQHDNNRDKPLPAPTYQSSIALPAQSGIYEELDQQDDDALGSLTQHKGFHNIAMTIDGDGKKHEYDSELPKVGTKSSGHYEN